MMNPTTLGPIEGATPFELSPPAQDGRKNRLQWVENQEEVNMKKTDKKYNITVDRRSKNVAYITIGKWVIYIDNSTGEHIIKSWKE